MLMLKYAFLGIIQGLSEFLPVSSSAHLVFFQELLQIKDNQLILDIVLHLGTLLALFLFLFKDIKRLLNFKMLLFVALTTALTAGIVLLGKDFFEQMFHSPIILAFPLFITGVTLLGTRKFTQGMRVLANLKAADAFWLGIVQGFSVIPGLSRSGLTISVLLFRNLERETACKLSFLVSIPAILGAFFFKINDFSAVGLVEFRYLACGFLASCLSGLLALKILLAIILRARLYLFGYYCLFLALFLWCFVK